MEMTKQQVARVAQNTLNEFTEGSWGGIDALAKLAGTPKGDNIDNQHAGEEYLEVIEHPQSPGAMVIRYIRRTGQTPLQIVVNTPKAYIKIMLTCTEVLPGYEAFDEVPEFGKFQDKQIKLDWEELKKELQQLAKLK